MDECYFLDYKYQSWFPFKDLPEDRCFAYGTVPGKNAEWYLVGGGNALDILSGNAFASEAYRFTRKYRWEEGPTPDRALYFGSCVVQVIYYYDI